MVGFGPIRWDIRYHPVDPLRAEDIAADAHPFHRCAQFSHSAIGVVDARNAPAAKCV